jgi:protein involved in polysaccharide export with SLBB domain
MYKSLLLFLVLSSLPLSHQTVVAQTYAPKTKSEENVADTRVSTGASAEARTLLQTGLDLLDSGQVARAIASFEQAVKVDPKYADAYEALGRAYVKTREWQKAIDNFHRAAGLNTKTKQEQDDLHKTLLTRKAEAANQPPSPVTKTESRVEKPKPTQAQPSISQAQAESQVASAAPQPNGVKVSLPSTSKPAESIAATPIAPIEEISLTKVYRVGPNDVLDVRFNDTTPDAAKSTLFTITPSGLLEFPLLSEPLPVTGLTVEEIGNKIEDELTKRALVQDPKVVVGVRDYASHTILVSGLVKDSGTKILRREAIPLYVVVADAQPLPEAARVAVVRNNSNEMYEIDLTKSADMNLLVRPGDVVTIHPNETQFVYVGGEVKLPGEKTFRRGLTLTQVILTAGGVIPKAKFAQIARDDGRGFLTMTRVKLGDIESGKEVDPLVKPGDRIMIIR